MAPLRQLPVQDLSALCCSPHPVSESRGQASTVAVGRSRIVVYDALRAFRHRFTQGLFEERCCCTLAPELGPSRYYYATCRQTRPEAQSNCAASTDRD